MPGKQCKSSSDSHVLAYKTFVLFHPTSYQDLLCYPFSPSFSVEKYGTRTVHSVPAGLPHGDPFRWYHVSVDSLSLLMSPLITLLADRRLLLVNPRSFTYEQLSLPSSFVFLFLLSSKLLIKYVEMDRNDDRIQWHTSRDHPIGWN